MSTIWDRTDRDELPEISDDELTLLALAADPDMAVPDDARPIWEHLGGWEHRGDWEHLGNALLPSWYMPAPAAPALRGRGWKRVVALVVVAAFLGINALGLCSAYGWIAIG